VTASRDCLVVFWDLEDLNTLATRCSPALSAFWRNFALCQVGGGRGRRRRKGAAWQLQPGSRRPRTVTHITMASEPPLACQVGANPLRPAVPSPGPRLAQVGLEWFQRQKPHLPTVNGRGQPEPAGVLEGERGTCCLPALVNTGWLSVCLFLLSFRQIPSLALSSAIRIPQAQVSACSSASHPSCPNRQHLPCFPHHRLCHPTHRIHLQASAAPQTSPTPWSLMRTHLPLCWASCAGCPPLSPPSCPRACATPRCRVRARWRGERRGAAPGVGRMHCCALLLLRRAHDLDSCIAPSPSLQQQAHGAGCCSGLPPAGVEG
jgi:hypothetical protein